MTKKQPSQASLRKAVYDAIATCIETAQDVSSSYGDVSNRIRSLAPLLTHTQWRHLLQGAALFQPGVRALLARLYKAGEHPDASLCGTLVPAQKTRQELSAMFEAGAPHELHTRALLARKNETLFRYHFERLGTNARLLLLKLLVHEGVSNERLNALRRITAQGMTEDELFRHEELHDFATGPVLVRKAQVLPPEQILRDTRIRNAVAYHKALQDVVFERAPLTEIIALTIDEPGHPSLSVPFQIAVGELVREKLNSIRNVRRPAKKAP